MPAEEPGPATTKARMLNSAASLLRERGVGGVTVDAVLAHSGAPRGSVYHHFPGGRNELVLAALEQAGDAISGLLERAAAEGDARRAVDRFIRFWKRTLTDSQFRAGCPAVAVAVDSRRDIPQAAETVQRIFATWHVALTGLLTADGYSADRAERLATMILAGIEGAVILARARADVTPLDDVAAEIGLLLEQG
jgi:AcrR family transcriptional regulator